MRQFQITIPEDKSLEVYNFLHDEEGIEQIAKIHAGNLFIYSFRVANDQTNSLLGSLQRRGIGKDFGFIDILPIETSIPHAPKGKTKPKTKGLGIGISDRLTVEAIYSNVVSSNNMTFDFVTMLCMAGLIAAAGLAANSVVSVVAAMLVSPLMGPIIAFSLGVVINDWDLVARGLKNEILSLTICATLGFFYAFPFLPFIDYLDWPTSEMSGRGQAIVLIFGVLVASPSGIAVAISLTSSNIAGLVGVAISASLLPPAINAGMCFNLALFGPLIDSDISRIHMLILAGTSFSLTMVNIACINIFVMVFFKIKKIAPITSSSDIFTDFQGVDLKPSHYHELYHQDSDAKVDDIMAELDALDALPTP